MTTVRCMVLNCRNNMNKTCIANDIIIDENLSCWIFETMRLIKE